MHDRCEWPPWGIMHRFSKANYQAAITPLKRAAPRAASSTQTSLDFQGTSLQQTEMSYSSVSTNSPRYDSQRRGGFRTRVEKPLPIDWHGGPQTLQAGIWSSIFSWAWEVTLTMGPLIFIGLFFISLYIDGLPISPYGDQVQAACLLSPTIYPILFAAIASRFYRNIARWRLEKRNGIKLATLEQVFGSQSLAGAVERLVFVRTQVLVGVLVVLTWALSPLGGQSAARLLHVTQAGNATASGNVSFVNPIHQISSFLSSSRARVKPTINTLYCASLLSSEAQKRSPRDLWGLPKIPQLTNGIKHDGMRNIDTDALLKGRNHYASLLGTKIQGLNFAPSGNRYSFTVETSYYNFQCDLVKEGVPINDSSTYFPTNQDFDVTKFFKPGDPDVFNSFVAWINAPNSTLTSPSGHVSKPHMLYATLDRKLGSYFKYFLLFNCSMRLTVVATEVQCGPSSLVSSCEAKRQKRVDDESTANGGMGPLVANGLSQLLLTNWRTAEGSSGYYPLSPTDLYIAGNPHPFEQVELQDWTKVPIDEFSKRLTTAFNTYFDASLAPENRTTIAFDRHYPDPSESTYSGNYSTVLGTATLSHDIYRVDRRWAYTLLAVTCVLQIMALAGIALKYIIQAPDVLGFASSMTRDNSYVTLDSCGSALDGSDRARALGRLRVQLADVGAKDELGYIAFRVVPPMDDGIEEASNEDQKYWRPLDQHREYI